MKEEFMIDLLKEVFPAMKWWSADDVGVLISLILIVVAVFGFLLWGFGKRFEFFWGYVGVVMLVSTLVVLIFFCIRATERRNTRLMEAAMGDKEVAGKILAIRESVDWLRNPANVRYPVMETPAEEPSGSPEEVGK